MRILMIVPLALLRVCGSDEAPPPAASGPAVVAVEGEVAVAAPAPALSATVTRPRHGGTVVVAEDHAVEVVAQPSGQVYAYVVDAQGHVPPAAEVNLTVNVHGSDGELHPAVLVWNPTELRYVGRVSVTPAPGEVEVVLVRGGRPRRGRVDTYVIVPAPAARAEVVVGAPRGEVVVGAPRGEVVVAGPRVRAGVDVRIEAPPPPSLDVRIGVGAPRGVVVVENRPRTVVIHDHRKHRKHRGHRGRGHGHDRH